MTTASRGHSCELTGADLEAVETLLDLDNGLFMAAKDTATLAAAGRPSPHHRPRGSRDRHACVSTWLNGGIAPAQVAEWAGHSIAILLRIYAKCVDGQDDISRRRIEEPLGDPGDDDTPEPGQPDDGDKRH